MGVDFMGVDLMKGTQYEYLSWLISFGQNVKQISG